MNRSGLHLYRGEVYKVRYPDGWERHEGKDSQGNPAVEVNGPPTEDGAYSGRVHIVTWENWPYEFQDKLTQVRSASLKAGYRIHSDEPVTVKHAQRAHRFAISYVTKTVIGKSVRLRETRTLVLTTERTLIEFAVSGPDEPAVRDRLEPVVDSFKLS